MVHYSTLGREAVSTAAPLLRKGLDWIGLDLWKSPCLLWLVFLFLLGGEEDPGVVVLPRQLTVKRREDTIIGHL
jgi:hypothetical protein